MAGKRRYTNGYMIYGCSECGRGFKMYLEENLETHGPDHKPVPFTICCPFCSTPNCRDVSFKKIKVERRRIMPYMPAFINNKGDSCGVPINLERAQVEYAMGDRAAAAMEEENIREKLIPILRSGHVGKLVKEAYLEFVEKHAWEKMNKKLCEELSLNVLSKVIDHLKTAMPEYNTDNLSVNSYQTEDNATGIELIAKFTSDPRSRGVIVTTRCRKELEQNTAK